MNKEAVVKSVSDIRAEWQQVIDELGPEGLERPGAQGEWRVRDVLAHFNGWDRWQLVQLRSAFTGESPTEEELTGGIEYPPNEDMSEDAMNAMFFEGNRSRPVDQIVSDWQEVSDMRATWVVGASQEQLEATVGADWAGYPRIMRLASEVTTVTNPEQAWERIADQIGHQRIHLQAVREWMKS